jgi:hypothetical protein
MRTRLKSGLLNEGAKAGAKAGARRKGRRPSGDAIPIVDRVPLEEGGPAPGAETIGEDGDYKVEDEPGPARWGVEDDAVLRTALGDGLANRLGFSACFLSMR